MEWMEYHDIFHRDVKITNEIVVNALTLMIKDVCDSGQSNMKSENRSEAQPLRAGCSKAEPKLFAPPQTTFPGVQDGQNLISWR